MRSARFRPFERTDSSRAGASLPASVGTNLFQSGKILFPSRQHLHSYIPTQNAISRLTRFRPAIRKKLIMQPTISSFFSHRRHRLRNACQTDSPAPSHSNYSELIRKLRPIIKSQFGMFFHFLFFRPDAAAANTQHPAAQAPTCHTESSLCDLLSAYNFSQQSCRPRCTSSDRPPFHRLRNHVIPLVQFGVASSHAGSC